MKKLVLSTLFVLQAIFVFAQQKPALRGKVVDSKSLKPLQNVAATIQSTNVSVVTDVDGTFEFETLPNDEPVLVISYTGYVSQTLILEPTKGETLELGEILLEEDITSEQQLSLVTITENDLGDENTGSESTSGLLQASRDTYQQAAAFNWGMARFRIRGLDNAYGTTMINGISMNKLYDGRPQWSNWGGLNDATRNQEFTMGSGPSDYTFGGILGTQEINTRASHYRTGTRISLSGTNTNYSWRTMGTHASGFNKKGWAFVVSASRRWAKEGFFEGTDYSANSLFASVEKKFNDKHSLNFTSIYAENSRGKTSPNTKEVNDLMGVTYNSYWGWQNGEKRNSRDKDIAEPINMLSHYWKISEKTSLNTNVAYQTGKIGNSRIDYQNANNPDPTYYGYMPNYYYNQSDLEGAAIALDHFYQNPQINWNAMYIANQNSADVGRSVYALYEDRTDDTQWSANSILNSSLSDNISLNAAVNFKHLKSHNFQNLLDLLGGQYFLDIDPFYSGDTSQSDLNNPNRQVVEGDTYGYNYNLFATVIDGFTQFKFNYRKFNFYLAQSFSRTEYQREGLYKNGIYADNSYGKSDKVTYENFGFKGGLTYKINGRHMLDFNGSYMTKAPIMRNVFSNARLNNTITPNLSDENIVAADASYIIKAPKFKGRLTGFYNKIQNSTEISFYYAESIGDAGGDSDSFVSEIVTGLDKQAIGGELGLEYQITSTIKAMGSASYGQYIYSNNAHLVTNDDGRAADGLNALKDFGTVYIKDYRQPGMPQQAYSIGLEYRDPHFWWVSANVNYLADNYIDVASILRTDNFTIDPSTGVNYDGATESSVRDLLKQEKFDNFTLVNLTGGKSWRISKKNRNTFGFFASINNLFDVEYKTGGFEQSRKATYPDLAADQANGTPSFGSKYFYGYGRTYFVNFYINF
ncbi:TonB-dependent receptor [Flavobacterium sp. NRK F10]|uniref:TonB-dependent receptor n=1 Tax=Flavobacterium sediminis TaxID=2201181 RepID=A0A2U8QUL7_9FLAO|nr:MULTISPECIES: carboxypeptidase-like regulatory domain-containing protein [Flavobacterium]AWM13566.1 TonB-dependent receptor [Flavobacterium sediminis]MCO6174690.1 TonB-dependent receptor [Flavobacterium sp. NRK F10]